MHLGPLLTARGFELEEVDADIVYGERGAWVMFYRSADCKLQICWSARDGGIDFMLDIETRPRLASQTNISYAANSENVGH